jgi:hypothetical protein
MPGFLAHDVLARIGDVDGHLRMQEFGAVIVTISDVSSRPASCGSP